jgi:four helix bundle protein
MFRFEKLDAWQLAVELADVVYRVSRPFPHDERFGLSSQIRRAAVSIAANLAEGSGRTSDRDNLRFVEMSYGSLMEVVSHAVICRRQGFLAEESYSDLYSKCDRLARVLSGLRHRLDAKGEGPITSTLRSAPSDEH